MMKIFAALAVIAIAVSAETYNYTAPKLPCAYQLKVSTRETGGELEELMTLARNDDFIYMKMTSDDEVMHVIYRPDITTKKDGEDMIGAAVSKDGECESDYYPKSEYKQLLNTLYDTLFGTINKLTWDSKNETKYEGKKCTLYYNSDYGYGLYVYEDYPYVIAAGSTEQIYEWEWDIPLDKFKLKECEGKFSKAPSSEYSKCAGIESSDASITGAFGAVVFAFIAATVVALF